MTMYRTLHWKDDILYASRGLASTQYCIDAKIQRLKEHIKRITDYSRWQQQYQQ